MFKILSKNNFQFNFSGTLQHFILQLFLFFFIFKNKNCIEIYIKGPF